MIARSFILFLLLDILPFLYFYLRFFYKKAEMWKQVLLWIPCVLMVAYTTYLAMEPNFIPDNDRILMRAEAAQHSSGSFARRIKRRPAGTTVTFLA